MKIIKSVEELPDNLRKKLEKIVDRENTEDILIRYDNEEYHDPAIAEGVTIDTLAEWGYKLEKTL